jgi:hypothetical protein
MKLAVIAGFVLTSFVGSAAHAADMYLNVEANTGFVQSEMGAVTTEAHIGVEDTTESGASWYVQAGPMLNSNTGVGETTLDLSGKLGGSVPVNSRVDLYGELSFASSDMDTAYGAKLGTKFKF